MEHHAYYMEGSASQFDALKEELKPFWAQSFERFGIDEARELRTLASLRNFKNATFLLAASAITSEAQQALLKLFEEPQEKTVFVVLLPHGVLLPTLRSRMLRFETQKPAVRRSSDLLSQGQARPFTQQASSFLKGSGKARSDMVAELLKDDEGERERVRDFVYALEVTLSKKIKDPAVRAGLGDIEKVRMYLNDRSPSLKMLLEHLALSLPVLK